MSKSSKSARDNRANQLNPAHPAYHRSRGATPDEAQRMAGHGNPVPGDCSAPPNPDDTAHQTAGAEGSTAAPPTSSRTSSAKSD